MAAAATLSLLRWGDRLVRFGILWVVATVVPFVLFASFGPKDQYFHTASAGFAMALGGLLWRLAAGGGLAPKKIAVTAALILGVAYGVYGVVRTQQYVRAWREAGEMARRIITEVRTQHPSLPLGSALYFVGIPRHNGLVTIFNNGIGGAMRLVYADPTLQVAYTFDRELTTALAQEKGPAGPGPRPGVYVFAWTGRLEDRSGAFAAIEGTLSGGTWIFTAVGR